MSRKKNDGGSRGKARDYGGNGTCGMSKHRASGRPTVNKVARAIATRERNAEEARRAAAKRNRTSMHESVEELMRDR